MSNKLDAKYYVRVVVGLTLIVWGIAHFTFAPLFESLIPPILHNYRAIVNFGMGIVQIPLGIAFFYPQSFRFIRWTTIFYLILTLPAFRPLLKPSLTTSLDIAITMQGAHLLLQLFVIVLVLWSTQVASKED